MKWILINKRFFFLFFVFFLVFLVFLFLTKFHQNPKVSWNDETGFRDGNVILDSSGQYRIFPSVFEKSQKAKKNEKKIYFSLVSHCTKAHLNLLSGLAKRWQGPISLALFVEPSDLQSVFLQFNRLRNCDKNLQKFFDVHFVTIFSDQNQDLPWDLILESQKNAEEDFQCSEISEPDRNVKKTEPANYDHEIPYPNNLLRNIGRKFSKAQYVFVIDIDMIPSQNLHSNFVNFIKKRNKNTEGATGLEVFVVPAFEIDTETKSKLPETKSKLPETKSKLPETKSDLLKLLNRFVARPFYFEVCWRCQQATDFQIWSTSTDSEEMEISHHVTWKDPWEPFFIVHNTAPMYDERFKQYGFNRISHACQIHIAGYSFSVLNNAFLVHQGFKTKKKFHKTKEEELTRNRFLYSAFKKELEDVYPDSGRSCW